MNLEQVAKMEAAVDNDYANMAGIVIRKDGEVVYEKYFNGCSESSHIHVSSVTKSMISILMGIAMDKGYIHSVDQKVLEFFPEYAVKRGEKTIQKITLKDMLTMTVPYKFKFNPYTQYFTSMDWVKFSLDKMGGKGTIGEFRYAPIIGPDVLSGILTKVTGQSVLDFAREQLFAPLGISVGDSITFHNKEEQMAFYKSTEYNGWVAGPKGVHTAGWGLTLTPGDMAKIGQLFLNDGMWNGKHIVSGKWVDESTKEQSRWKQRDLPYGYLWWIVESQNVYAAMGDGGNIIYINKPGNMVVAITSLFQPGAKDRIAFIKEYVEPAFANESEA